VKDLKRKKKRGEGDEKIEPGDSKDEKRTGKGGLFLIPKERGQKKDRDLRREG